MSSKSPGSVKKILGLLEEITTLEVVRAFLKSKGLAFSAGSWKKLAEDRIYPAVDSGKLTSAELLDLLRNAEEHGRQHVFLYKVSPAVAKKLLDKDTVGVGLKKLGLLGLLKAPQVLNRPDEPTISEVRRESTAGVEHLIIKIVESKVSQELVSENLKGTKLTKVYEYVKERAVSVAKISSNGDIELRIGSRSRHSRTYREDAMKMMNHIEPIVDLGKAVAVSLDTAKDRIWAERESLSKIIRYSNATLRDDSGYSIRASTATQLDDLNESEGVSDSMNTFLQHEAYCDSNNIFFKESEDGLPSRDIHVLMSGEANEFALTVHCNKADYEYVLRQLQLLNK